MHKPVKTGGSVQDNLEVAAIKGNSTAIRLLKGPPRPYVLAHLWQWHVQLQQGLGEGFNTARASLDWPKLDAWARRSKVDPSQREMSALFLLDTIARYPDFAEKVL